MTEPTIAAPPRQFGLAQVVPRGLMDDQPMLQVFLDRMHEDLDASLERQGYEPTGSFEVSVHLETELMQELLPQSWWDWLLRRPRRYPPPLYVIRMSALCVLKETADAG